MTLPEPYYDRDGITIYHGDCREILPEVGTLADVLITDPPFGISYESGSLGTAWWHGKQIPCDGSTLARDVMLEWWKPQKPALIFGSWKAERPDRTRTVLIWDKGPALGMGALDLPWKPSYEEIYVIGKGFRGRRDGAVIYCPPVQSMAKNGRVHPNEKPVKLLRMLIEKCPDGVILDPFMGSGTTLRAAKDLGRKAIGIEIEERYCEIAVKRLSQQVLPLEVTP